jgi:adenosyl cobinamide kinase/adenosyl cobinamide phosphate guanylyltransferase
MFVMDQNPNSRLQQLVKQSRGDRPEGWQETEELKQLQFVSNVQKEVDIYVQAVIMHCIKAFMNLFRGTEKKNGTVQSESFLSYLF